MKSTTLNHNQQPPCEKQNFSCSQASLHLASVSSTAAKNSLWSQPAKTIAYALQVTRATLVALSNEVGTDNRLLAGLAIMFGVSPLICKAYLLFPHTAINPQWFHLNLHYLLINLGDNIATISFITGIWFLFQKSNLRRYLLLAPAGYYVGDTVHKFFATSNESYNAIAPLPYFLAGVIFLVLVIAITKSILYLHNHIRLGFEQRVRGIIHSPLDASTKMDLLNKAVGDHETRLKNYLHA